MALAVAIPALLFTALQTTNVTSVVLPGRFEAVAHALFAWVLLGQRVGRRQLAGYAVLVAGILVLVFVQGMANLSGGDRIVILAAVLQGLAACVSNVLARRHSVRAFVFLRFLRNFASAVAFFAIAVVLYGLDHFADAFAPGLWVAMLVYGLGVVAVGQLAWYRGLQTLPPATVASWSMLLPAMAIGFAYLLLGEVPTAAQVIGGVVIAAGVIVTITGRRPPGQPAPQRLMEKSLAAV